MKYATAFIFGLLLSTFAQAAISPETIAPLTAVTLADGRQVLADAEGMTVYTFDPDEANVSNCFDSCIQAWPATTVEKDAVLGADLGSLVRSDDGSRQLTFGGQPLYFFVKDAGPGDITGDGLGGVWHIVVLK